MSTVKLKLLCAAVLCGIISSVFLFAAIATRELQQQRQYLHAPEARLLLSEGTVPLTVGFVRDNMYVCMTSASGFIVIKSIADQLAEPSVYRNVIPIQCAAISGNGERIGFVDEKDCLVVMNSRNGERLLENKAPIPSPLTMALSYDGLKCALADKAGNVVLCDVTRDACHAFVASSAPRSLAYSRDNQYLLCDVWRDSRLYRTCDMQAQLIFAKSAVDVDPLAIRSEDGAVIGVTADQRLVIAFANGQEYRTLGRCMDQYASSIAIASQGESCIFGCLNGMIEVCGLDPVVRKQQWCGHTTSVARMDASRDGQHLLSASSNVGLDDQPVLSEVKLWKLR